MVRAKRTNNFLIMIPEVFISAIKIMKKDRIRCYNGIKYNEVIPNLCNFAATN
jgi:hypothetical protein